MINKSILPQEIQDNPELTIGELAERHNANYQAMATAIKKAGVRAKRKKTIKKRLNEGSRAFKVLSYLMANPEMNFAAIAEQFNCTREYVSLIEAMARNEGIIK